MTLLLISFLLMLLIDGNDIALAFSTGAGGCDPGGAVSGLHLSSPTTGALAFGNFQLVLDGTPLLPNELTPVTASQIYSLGIQPIGDATFRGALIRVEDQGTTLIPGENSVQATACVEAAGLTHASNELKTTFEATIQVEAGSESIVELNVVVSNSSPLGSIYYYDQFTLTTTQAATSVAAPAIGVGAMTPMLVEAPVAMTPIIIPVVTPTIIEAPVARVEAPVAIAPTSAVPDNNLSSTNDDGGLTNGAMVGVVVAVVITMLMVGGWAGYVVGKRKVDQPSLNIDFNDEGDHRVENIDGNQITRQPLSTNEPVVPLAVNVPVTRFQREDPPTQSSDYVVQYKDQSRSVIGSTRIVQAIPDPRNQGSIAYAIPVASALTVGNLKPASSNDD